VSVLTDKNMSRFSVCTFILLSACRFEPEIATDVNFKLPSQKLFAYTKTTERKAKIKKQNNKKNKKVQKYLQRYRCIPCFVKQK
jgi:hypothetical protein